jgi:hypothetical protein
LQKREERANAVGQKIPARGSARFAGQRPCAAKKPFCRLDFLLLFIKEKEEAVPRRMSGPINSSTQSTRNAEFISLLSGKKAKLH